jgi:rSAM/selenodomain-associated transferase 2
VLAVVIPALDAAATLGATIDSVRDADEIVVVDGGSSDGTPGVAERSGARVIAASRGRGTQLHAGAMATRGDWLLFLHADTTLASGWRAAADRHMRERALRAACFRFALDADAPAARLIEWAVALRVGLFALPYGDQGLLISRELYKAVGGFRALPLMEDVDLVRRLGRARVVRIDHTAITSARRWLRDGWVKRSARNLVCLLLFNLGVSPERIARIYA